MAAAEPAPAWRTEGWLREKYHDEGLTQVEMARLGGVNQSDVSRAMSELGVATGVPSNQEPEEYQTEEWLRRKYHGEGLTLSEMAEEAGVADHTLVHWMKRHGVETRPGGIADEWILEDFRRLAEELGHPPNTSEWRERSRFSYHTVRNRFGSFGEARRAAFDG